MSRAFAVIPAAGQSQRMGQPKLLLPWRGRPVIEHVLDSWKQSPVAATVVVVRADDRVLADVCGRGGAEVVLADPPPPEMKASIARGLSYIATRYAPHSDDLWLVAPADLPQLSPQAIAGVIAHADRTAASIVVPSFAGRRGHPVALRWQLAAELTTLAAHEGLNNLLDQHDVAIIDFPELAAPSDLDTPDDYQQLLRG